MAEQAMYARKSRRTSKRSRKRYSDEEEPSSEESELSAPRRRGVKYPPLADLERIYREQTLLERKLEKTGTLEKELARADPDSELEILWNEEQKRYQTLPETVRVFVSACHAENLDDIRDYDEYKYAPEPYKQAMDQMSSKSDVCHTLGVLSATRLTPSVTFYDLGRHRNSYFWYDPKTQHGGCRRSRSAREQGIMCGAYGKYNRTFVWYDPKTREGEIRRAAEDPTLVCNLESPADEQSTGRIVCAEPQKSKTQKTSSVKSTKSKKQQHVRFASPLQRMPSLL